MPNIYPCKGTDSFGWSYYPPSPFKILLYFPEYDSFVVSEIYEEYAFDSYYKVDLDGVEIEKTASDIVVKASQSYQYGKEMMALLVRIVLTILVELGIALLVGYREKKLLRFLIPVNVITQVLLNIRLNIIGYYNGTLELAIHYVQLEVLVFVIEALLYTKVLPEISEKKIRKSSAVMYAFVANLASFIVGIFMAMMLPEFF